MSGASWSAIKAQKFSVGDKAPVGRQAAIPAATGEGDEEVINAIIAVLVAYGLVEEEMEES